jgi:hypothetical protein
MITSTKAWANNEVAYVAWDIDEKIEGCLGFDVTRIYLNPDGSVALKADGSEDRVRCATWVAFKGQKNPLWLPQDTSVWPVQKMSWRDLTLRKKRDGMKRRPDEVLVRYEIRPVGKAAPGLDSVVPTGKEMQSVVLKDDEGKPILNAAGKKQWISVRSYEGTSRKLAYLAPAVSTEAILITSRRGQFRSTFTNGILSAQWLRNVLNEDGVIEKNELYNKICDPNDPHRKYLAGDVIPLIHDLLSRKGKFYLSLYELEDKQLEDLLIANASKLHVILSNTGVSEASEWDVRNAPARQRLIDAGVDIQHRMFNNGTHIGHNKFVVHVPSSGVRSVLTGSTNWTSTGIAGQTNNALLIESNEVAKAFLDYWKRLKADELPLPDPLSDEMKDNQPGAELREANAVPNRVTMANGAELAVWFAPNRPERKKPTSKTKPTPVPPDLEEVYRRMRMAKDAILFLAFYPGMAGKDCIVGEAITIGQNDSSLLVAGAVSSAQAMPNYVAKKKKDGVVIEEGESPTTYSNETGNVSIVRASNIDDRTICGDLGIEPLTAKGGIGAIIHDKLVVIDPNSDDCTVVLGSHNIGFKASYSNDENMLIITGDRELAMAYAVHILDVTDHYRFRAIEKERADKGQKGWSGFLRTDDKWQDGYVSGEKRAISRYLAK